MARSTETSKAPKPNQTIVWRFRGDRGWRRSYVREAYASGKVIELASGLSCDLVSLQDIEWHPE